MKKKKTFVGKPTLNSIQCLKLENEDLQNIFGGFREYIPQIYDEKQTRITTENYSNLLSININNTNNETTEEI